MRRDRMQQQRFELKYLIPEETALLVRDFVRSYLEMDEYSVGRPNSDGTIGTCTATGSCAGWSCTTPTEGSLCVPVWRSTATAGSCS